MSDSPRVPCVGGVVRDAAGRLLLVRRANPPAQGTWSLPGGRIEPGESEADAVRRELGEETGLQVEAGPLIGTTEIDGPGGLTYEVRDYACTVVGGTLVAGDDASDVGWFGPDEVDGLRTPAGLVPALVRWGVLPARPDPPDGR